MRWLVKTSLDGEPLQDVQCDNAPSIPDQGAALMLPLLDESFLPGIVSELQIDLRGRQATLKVICVSPSANKSS
mgnify:CR=1 FL=1